MTVGHEGWQIWLGLVEWWSTETMLKTFFSKVYKTTLFFYPWNGHDETNLAPDIYKWYYYPYLLEINGKHYSFFFLFTCFLRLYCVSFILPLTVCFGFRCMFGILNYIACKQPAYFGHQMEISCWATIWHIYIYAHVCICSLMCNVLKKYMEWNEMKFKLCK